MTDENPDTCTAIVGIDLNHTIVVKKYCIPMALSEGVTGKPTQTWYVWYSEEWSMTATSIHFSDVTDGDTLIVVRNNKNGDYTKGPLEQFISIHPRSIQLDVPTYTLNYGTTEARNERLTIAPSSLVINGMLSTHVVQGIADLFVLPTGGDERKPWVMMSLIVSGGGDGITSSGERDICIRLNIPKFIEFRGGLETDLQACNMYNFFQLKRDSSYLPVVLPAVSMSTVPVMFIPSKQGVDLCVFTISFVTEDTTGVFPPLFCYDTPNSFASNAKFPTIQTWSDISSSTFMGANHYTGAPVLSQDGIALNVRKRTSQNSLVYLEENVGTTTIVKVFITNDPQTPVHWLQQVCHPKP
jgi:hypothetical protein